MAGQMLVKSMVGEGKKEGRKAKPIGIVASGKEKGRYGQNIVERINRRCKYEEKIMHIGKSDGGAEKNTYCSALCKISRELKRIRKMLF